MVATAVTLVMTATVLAGLFGAAGAVPASAPVTSASWAYGGEGWSGGAVSLDGGLVSASWNASFGLVVIFNATPTGPNTVELEEQRTAMLDLTISASNATISASFSLHALETDLAYANVTNASTVYVDDSPVAALGVLNASAAVHASLNEAASIVEDGAQANVSLAVSANVLSSVDFSPSLGLIPLNLTGVTAWNSSATATPQANWNISWSWGATGFNGTSASGANSSVGSWTTSAPVSLTGSVFTTGLPTFHDHRARTGVVLLVSGPADLYDGFVFVPHAADLFGGASEAYDSDAVSTATISGESLFVTDGAVSAGSISAAQATYGSGIDTTLATAGAFGAAAPAPAASDTGATVTAQPESPSQAQSQAHCFDDPSACGAGSPWFSGLVAVGVIALVVGAIAGTVGVIEWRSYARRKSRQQLVGGYGSQLTNGVPPGATVPPTPQVPGGMAPSDPMTPNRPL